MTERIDILGGACSAPARAAGASASSHSVRKGGSMPQGIPASWKNCGSCEFWSGARKPSTFRDQAEVEDTSFTGECVGGGCDRMQMTAMGNCTQWRKWGVLQ